jgi:hypothetical protein
MSPKELGLSVSLVLGVIALIPSPVYKSELSYRLMGFNSCTVLV